MSRIRSLHPGLFTDDRYMALSLAARELIKGIWCEADDQGVFEWRPLTLKARIMPADAVDVSEILDELVAGKFVTRFEYNDHSFGAVRNFRKFQRPKKPNSIHLLPPEFANYVGLGPPGGELSEDKPTAVPHQFPTEGGKPPQMEDGGGRREDEGKKGSVPNGTGAGAPSDDPVKAIFDRGVAILGEKGRGLIGKARKEHGDLVVLSAITSCEDERPSDPASFFVKCLVKAAKHQANGGVLPNEGVF